MKSYQLFCNAKTKYDVGRGYRDIASKVMTLNVTASRWSAVKVAEAIDKGIPLSEIPAVFTPQIRGDNPDSIATYHGVTIKYPSGKMRAVRA